MGVKKLGQSTVAVSPGTTLYTVPTGYITDIEDILITNTTSSVVSLSMSIVDSGGSMATANHIFSAAPIQANTTIQWTGSQTMNAGDFIKAFGSTAGINIRVCGNERRLGA